MRSNMSGAGFYNSESRNFSRGFGRGNPRNYQSSQPPPSPQPTRKGDIFVEAGQFAVEYLVSHGLLSSDVLPGKAQNGTSKNNYGDSQDNRSLQENELSNSLDGRSVATTRLRASSPDGVSTNRRSFNDQDMSSLKSYSMERRRHRDSRSNSFDSSSENGRVGSLPEKASSFQAMEVDCVQYPKDSSKEEVSDVLVSRSTESVDNGGKTLVDSDSKTLKDKDDEEIPKPTDNVKEETKDGTCCHEQEEENKGDDPQIRHSENNDDATKEKTSVMKVHSFMTDKILKSEPLLISEGMEISDTGLDIRDSGKDDMMSGSSGISPSNGNPSANFPGNALSDHSFKSAGGLDQGQAVNQPESVESLPFTDKGFSLGQKSSKLPLSEMCSSITKDRGDKRALEEDHTTDVAKKSKQWLSVAQSDEYLQLSYLSDKKPISVEKRDTGIFNELRFPNVSMPLKGGLESVMDRGEEKQLFSSSYKIFDLNLMGASDAHENHGVTGLLYPSLSVPKVEPHIDVDLSMSDNCSFTREFNDSGYARKDVEIIDLESPSRDEDESLQLSTKNAEAGISNVETFTENPQHPNDNPDGQDVCGLMISELLGNDAPNCSTVQPDISSLHNDMGLHHGEGVFNEDDPIYMSLGEIPLTGLLRAWEQPTQERNPFEL